MNLNNRITSVDETAALTARCCHGWTKGNVDDFNLTPEQVNKCIKIFFVQLKIQHNISLLSNIFKCLCTYAVYHNISLLSILSKCLCTYVVDHTIALKVQEHYKHLCIVWDKSMLITHVLGCEAEQYFN